MRWKPTYVGLAVPAADAWVHVNAGLPCQDGSKANRRRKPAQLREHVATFFIFTQRLQAKYPKVAWLAENVVCSSEFVEAMKALFPEAIFALVNHASFSAENRKRAYFATHQFDLTALSRLTGSELNSRRVLRHRSRLWSIRHAQRFVRFQVELRVALRRAACTDTDIERAADAKRADWVYSARTERCHREASEPCGPADERHKGCHRSALRRRQSRGREGATGDRTTAQCDALSCSCDGTFSFGEDRSWARVLFRSGSVKKKRPAKRKRRPRSGVWCELV